MQDLQETIRIARMGAPERDEAGRIDGYELKSRVRSAGPGPKPRRLAIQITLRVPAIEKLDSMCGTGYSRSTLIEALIQDIDPRTLVGRPVQG